MTVNADAKLIVKLRVEVAKIGLRKWAAANGFSPTFISQVLAGKSKVSARLAAALGYKRVEGWEKAK